MAYVEAGYFVDNIILDDIYVEWGSKLILIPKVAMILTQSNPSEIYQLDMNVFRLRLKDLEDDEAGMTFPDTHQHNPPVTVSGAVLSRVVEIINDYVVEFEDGQYRVNVVGANTNIGERVLVNQVSVSTSNSAGLQDLNSLQAASFGGEVTVDVNSNFSGTTFPVGTRGNPVNNLENAKSIAESRGITTIHLASNLTLSSGDFSEAFIFTSDGSAVTTLTIEDLANISNCTFKNMTIQGVLDNGNTIRDCNILDVTNINGFIFDSALSGTITLGGNTQSTISGCYSGIPGGSTPTINMGGSGNSLALRNYSGGIAITNHNGADPISVDLSSGQVILDSSVTNGTIIIRGVGKLTNNATGSAVVIEELLDSVNLNKTAFTNGAVFLDSSSPSSGTLFPSGTVGKPVSSLADAITIANDNGLRTINISGFFEATASHNLSGISLVAGSGASDTVHLNGCSTANSSFDRLILYGALNGLARINSCILGTTGLGGLTEVEGRIVNCIVNHPDGLIQKTAGAGTLLDNCSFIAPNNPQITMDANGKSFSLRNCTGNIVIKNKTDVEQNQVFFNGDIEIDSTCTAGGFIVEGQGQLTDNSAVGCTVVDNMIPGANIVKKSDIAPLY